MVVFSDLFVFGLALEIAAAYLLGRGLLSSPSALAKRNDKHGSNSVPVDVQRAVDETLDAVDGSIGFGLLTIGFVLQAVAYVVQIATPIRDETGSTQALIAICILGLTLAAVALVHRSARRKLLLKQVARFAVESQTIYTPKGWSDVGVLILVEAAHTPQIDTPPGDPHNDDTARWLESVFPVSIFQDSFGSQLVSLR